MTGTAKPVGLLAIDIDGTLITDHGHITPRVHDALERAHHAGWELVPASGRTWHAALPVIEEVPWFRYAVLSNGACILDIRDGSLVRLNCLDPALVHEVVGISRNQGSVPALYTSDIHNQKVYYDTLDGADEYFSWYVREDPRAVRVGNVLDYAGDVLQIGMVDATEVIFAISRELAALPVTAMTMPFESTKIGGKIADHWFIQVVDAMAKKHIALVDLAARLGIPEHHLVAVGDNYNDRDMISNAAVGVAMGNAPDEIKALARVVVATNNHSGIADVVDDVLLSGKYFS